MSTQVTRTARTVVVTRSPVGLRGATGPQGPAIAIQGTLTWAEISAVADPPPGHIWILSAADAQAPARADDTAAEAGDGIYWADGAWENSGPLRGPQGPSGAAASFEGFSRIAAVSALPGSPEADVLYLVLA